MRGSIVINAETGRTLRHRTDALMAADVLDCAGAFHPGDTVYVVVRGHDGGQGVVASGIVRCDAAILLQGRGRSIDPSNSVVIHAEDLRLLWPSNA